MPFFFKVVSSGEYCLGHAKEVVRCVAQSSQVIDSERNEVVNLLSMSIVVGVAFADNSPAQSVNG